MPEPLLAATLFQKAPAGYNGRTSRSLEVLCRMPILQSVREEARTAVAEGNYERALSLVQRIRRSFPDDLETMELLGQIHLACERRAEARDLFQAILAVDPENLLARSGLAIICEEEGDLPEALEHFVRAFEIDASSRQIAGEIRRLNSLAGRPRSADAWYSKHGIARHLMKEGMYEQAIPLFEAAMETNPEPAAVALGMAQALWLAGRVEEAEDVAGEILDSHPACLKALAIRAGAAHSRGDPEALTLLGKTASLNPGNGVARGIFEDAGIPFPAVGLDAEIPDEPAHPEERLEEGLPEEWDEHEDEEAEPFDLPEAEVEGEWVRDREPQVPPISPEEDVRRHLSSGQAYWTRGMLEPALAEYRTALELDGSVAAEVRQAALEMVESFPAEVRIRWLAADALLAEGQLRRAVEQYLIVLRSREEVATRDRLSWRGQSVETEKEQDGTYSGNRQARWGAAWPHRRGVEAAGGPRPQDGWPEDDGSDPGAGAAPLRRTHGETLL